MQGRQRGSRQSLWVLKAILIAPVLLQLAHFHSSSFGDIHDSVHCPQENDDFVLPQARAQPRALGVPPVGSSPQGAPDNNDNNANVDIGKNCTTKCRRKCTVAICAAIKDTEAYLMEWLDCHLIGLEFDQICLHDNSDNFESKRWHERSRDHPICSRVHVFHQPGHRHKTTTQSTDQALQHFIYYDCVYRFGIGKHGEDYNQIFLESPRHDYIAMIDADEFIVFQQQADDQGENPLVTIHDLLDHYLVPYGGALALNWMYFGTSNRTLYSPMPVTKRFQHRDARASFVIKTIVKSADYVEQLNPHGVRLQRGTNYHDTLFPGSRANLSDTAASNQHLASNVVLLHHYRFRSDKEYFHKQCSRGTFGNPGKVCREGDITNQDLPKHARPRSGNVFDDSAWRFLVKRVPKYGAFEGPEWSDFA